MFAARMGSVVELLKDATFPIMSYFSGQNVRLLLLFHKLCHDVVSVQRGHPLFLQRRSH